MNRDRLLERFLRYVRIGTTAKDNAGVYPSSPGQLVLGKLLLDELHAMGVSDAIQNDHGIIMATIPATISDPVETIAFNAHLDTSPETTGENVKPQVVTDYAGGNLVLPGDSSQIIRVDDNPELEHLRGKTLITTDGTTLLGGDDKAGIAIMMQMAEHFQNHADIQHGPIRLLFTCDEEIGHGVDYVDLDQLAARVCYTFDGGGANKIDVETFSADAAIVTVLGVNIHPSIAKNRMVNALRACGAFLDRMPLDQSPERTDGREGFLHPYTISGGVAEATLNIILRDFRTESLTDQADELRKIGAAVEKDFPGCQIEVSVRKQYRNLGDGLADEPRAVEFAKQAHLRLGRTPELTSIRGGTDGSLLTEKGLPTPNLSSGQHNPHSPLEWACLDEMVAAAEIGIEICKCWGEASE